MIAKTIVHFMALGGNMGAHSKKWNGPISLFRDKFLVTSPIIIYAGTKISVVSVSL